VQQCTSGTLRRSQSERIWFALLWPADQCTSLNSCAVSLKHEAALIDPLVKQRWIVLELEQDSSNLLRFWHSSVRGVKAGLSADRVGIGRVSQPPDISVAHAESRCTYNQDITITYLRGTGKGNDAAQIDLRTIFSLNGVHIVRSILKAIIFNYCCSDRVYAVEVPL